MFLWHSMPFYSALHLAFQQVLCCECSVGNKHGFNLIAQVSISDKIMLWKIKMGYHFLNVSWTFPVIWFMNWVGMCNCFSMIPLNIHFIFAVFLVNTGPNHVIPWVQSSHASSSPNGNICLRSCFPSSCDQMSSQTPS